MLEAALELRRKRPRWGAGKILGRLETLYPDWPLPARQVLHKHFVCEGLVKKRRRSRRRPHPGKPTASFDAPNAIWSADFKGHFKTRDGIYCYPLTIQDGFSRYLLGCQGLGGTTHAGTRRVFIRLFREFGLPERIRTDNGTPFASTALGRLSRLSIWWIKLGILPDLIEPASPHQNGRHDRAERTLDSMRATGYPYVDVRSAQLHMWQGEIETARSLLENVDDTLLRGNPGGRLAPIVAHIMLLTGDTARAEQLLQATEEVPAAPRDYYSGAALELAVAAVRGDAEAATAFLREAVRLGLRDARWIRASPVFSRVRDDPAFRAELRDLEQLVERQRRQVERDLAQE